MSDSEDFHSAPEDNDEGTKVDSAHKRGKTRPVQSHDVDEQGAQLSELHLDNDLKENISHNSPSLTCPEGVKDHFKNRVKDDRQEQSPEETTSGWSTWGSWGVTSLINTASKSATTLTSQVSHGLSSILESGLGAPDPSDLAKNLAEKDETSDQLDSSNLPPDFGLTNFVGGITSMGNKVITGGLDTLETLGKMTMEVLQEGDPGFRKKRMLFGEKTVLSELLREAKENVDSCEEEANPKPQEEAHYETLFDDFYGLMHLEALEMLSKQCDLKLKSMKSNFTIDDFETLKEIKDICTMPGPEDKEHLLGSTSEIFAEEFRDIFKNLDVAVKVDLEKFLQPSLNQVECDTFKCGNDIRQAAVTDLALSTASFLNVFHQVAEFLIQKQQRSPTSEVTEIVRLTTSGCAWIDSLLVHYGSLLDRSISTNPESIPKSQAEECKASIQTETAHSISYLVSAMELLVPILQLGALS